MTHSIFEHSPACKDEEHALYHEVAITELTRNLLHRAKEIVKGNSVLHIIVTTGTYFIIFISQGVHCCTSLDQPASINSRFSSVDDHTRSLTTAGIRLSD